MSLQVKAKLSCDKRECESTGECWTSIAIVEEEEEVEEYGYLVGTKTVQKIATVDVPEGWVSGHGVTVYCSPECRGWSW